MSDELKQKDEATNKTLIAPTDSRFRGDQRFFEDGKVQEADDEKVRLEIKQRKARADHAEAGTVHKPAFFETKQLQNPFTEEMEDRYVAHTGEKSYWQRREQLDWEGLPDIF